MITTSLFTRLKKEQAELDSFIYKQSSIKFEWISFWNAKRLKLALMTEIAEFANELRTFKIWAKKDKADENKVKEELIDCLCFFLGLVNLYQIDFPTITPVPFLETEFNDLNQLKKNEAMNDLLMDFFAKTYHLALVEKTELYPHQIKLTPVQLKTYQEWLTVFQHCCQKVEIKNEGELLSIYLGKKKINLGRDK